MSCSPKSTPAPTDGKAVLLGGDVMATSLPGKSDLSDWVELMEVVEALCPVWPAERGHRSGAPIYKL